MPCWVGIANAKDFNVGISKKMREQLSMLHHEFVPTRPEPKPQIYTTKLHILRP